MIPLTICVGFIAFVFWFVSHYERHIRVLSKRYELKVRLNLEEQEAVINACDVIMESYGDPQSNEYRNAMELKLKLERARRRN